MDLHQRTMCLHDEKQNGKKQKKKTILDVFRASQE
jgi:hypothetical protein